MQVEGYFMSTDEEMAARGRLVTTYSDTNRHFSTLLSEATRLGEILLNLGRNLTDARTLSIEKYKVNLTDAEKAALNGEKLTILLKDLGDTYSRTESLRKQVESLGLL